MAGWQIFDGKLTKEFIFSGFNQALDFVNRVGELSESVNHHPDIFLHSYKKVRITLFTHSENRISEKDHQLAEKIDAIISLE